VRFYLYVRMYQRDCEEENTMIQNQVTLPLRVALNVVMQGIRIRLGRSIITITGVVMGIAFLMSIMTGQILKKGVRDEDRIRTEVNRMYNFLTAESGPLTERRVAALISGNLSMIERRFITYLEQKKISGFTYYRVQSNEFPPLFRRLAPVNEELKGLAADVSALVILGDGDLPNTIDWHSLLENARQKVVGYMREKPLLNEDGVVSVEMRRKLTLEENLHREKEIKRERFRNWWIITISLLVTVIGITNAMLMSVTERFREIGTMKCLGAVSRFVQSMFLMESAFMGIAGSFVGSIIGFVFSFIAYSVTYGPELTSISLRNGTIPLIAYILTSFLIGTTLSVVAALYPASVASKMVPADALRTNV